MTSRTIKGDSKFIPRQLKDIFQDGSRYNRKSFIHNSNSVLRKKSGLNVFSLCLNYKYEFFLLNYRLSR